LDRDHRLFGKDAHQFDLPLGERLDPLPGKRDNADRLAVAQERHPKLGSPPGRYTLGDREVRVSADVCDLHDPTFERRPRGDAVATGDKSSLAQHRPKLGLRCAERTRHKAVDLALACCDVSGIGAAKPHGRFDYCVQHRLHMEVERLMTLSTSLVAV